MNHLATIFTLAALAYVFFLVFTILIGLPDAIGGIADAMAGPDRFGPDGIAGIIK